MFGVKRVFWNIWKIDYKIILSNLSESTFVIVESIISYLIFIVKSALQNTQWGKKCERNTNEQHQTYKNTVPK